MPLFLHWIRAIVAVLLLASMLGAEGRPALKARAARARSRLPEAVMAAPPQPVMEVAPVARSTRPSVVEAAARIDRLIQTHRNEHGVEPSRPLRDAEFVRRVYLELAGRIPSYDETVRFLTSKAADKRGDLVDDLLESPDYVSHFYNYWADVLRLQERPEKHLVLEPYLFYVKDSIRTNKPFDAWVHEMLTADGKPWENPAVGFQLRDEGMPLPYVDNTVRVFLGTQIGCAQCHDHPFDHWTQHEFYELAAFTAGTVTRPADRLRGPGRNRHAFDPESLAAAKAARDLQKQNVERNQKNKAAIAQFLRASVTSVAFLDRKLPLPHDYQYDDAKPLAAVNAEVLWGDVPEEARSADGREQFAAWVVSRDNRQFARTIANRLWKKVMGVGLVEPVDDFREGNPASNPELLEHLTDEMLRLKFDLREFVRLLVSTDAYQRQAVLHDPASAAAFHFTGPALRRMTAEQLWDSILTLVARNPWSVQRPTCEEVAAKARLDLEHATLAAVDAQLETFQRAFGRNQYKRRIDQICGYRGLELVRASELPAPLPLGHFLRQFGQGDRQSIEGSRTVATVPQILAMFNGPITHAMLEKGSVIYDNVTTHRENVTTHRDNVTTHRENVTSHRPQEAVDVVFLSVLSRKPNADDRRLALQEINSADDPATGCGNLIWALLNTREFIFIQ